MSVKHSSLVSEQLPSFIRDGISGYKISQVNTSLYNEDYRTFISFLEAYYEFLESSNNVYSESKKIISYKDVDSTIGEFQKYFFNEFLQYFPVDSFTNLEALTKFSRELYQRKGTPSSYKFLFRALFNSDCEIYNTKESVLTASGGNWVISKFVRLDTLDPNFLYLEKYKLFGEISKSIAKIERGQVVSNKTELYISDVVRGFTSGEFVKVVDNNLNDVLFDGQILRAKIVGYISKIEINPNFRGLSYKVGDPVVLAGGISPDIENPKKASAEVEEVSVGSVKSAIILDGANGFRLYPNTIVSVSSGGGGGTGVEAHVTNLDYTKPAPISYVSINEIITYANTYLDSNSYGFIGNPSANANTTLKNALDFLTVNTYPIYEVGIIHGGYNYTQTPIFQAESYFETETGTQLNVKDIGILSPINILYAGFNYSAGDVIELVGGSGIGAYANVRYVDANGSIAKVEYVYNENNLFPLGGINYDNNNLPTIVIKPTSNNISVNISTVTIANSGESELYISSTNNLYKGMYISGNGISNTRSFGYFNTSTTISYVDSTNNKILISSPLNSDIDSGENYFVDGTAILQIKSVLGEGENIASTIEKIGEIRKIKLTSSGEDYTSNPDVVLKVMDIIVYNLNELNPPKTGDLVYQGDENIPSFRGFVDSIDSVLNQPIKTYSVRLYNYNGTISSTDRFYIDQNELGSRDISFDLRSSYNDNGFVGGVKVYGNGAARANTTFFSGTVILKGQYNGDEGFLSSYGTLQSELYNNFTYILTVEKEFSKYKDILYNILHPASNQVSTRNAIKSADILSHKDGSSCRKIADIKHFTNDNVVAVLREPNILKFFNLDKEIYQIPLSTVVTTNSSIRLLSTKGDCFYSEILSIDDEKDTIYLKDSIILDYANVAYGFVIGNTNIVYVAEVTDKYDVINNGNYSNTNNKLTDIAFVGDKISTENNLISYINSIDYNSWIISTQQILSESGSADNPTLITISRDFVCEEVLVEYNLDYRVIEAVGNTTTNIFVDGFYVTDEYDNLIYISTEV